MALSINLERDGFSVVPASPEDLATRMLLPDAPADAVRLAAVEGGQGLVVGAAAFTPVFRRKPPAGPGVLVHVIEPARRRGVARGLLSQVERLVGPRGADALYAVRRVDEQGDEARAWRSLGFSAAEQVLEHDLPLDEFERVLAPLHERMARRGKIPADAQITPLLAADPQEVAELHVRYMGGDLESLRDRIEAGAFHPRYSRVLMLAGRAVGCILAHRVAREVAFVDADIVDERLRGGWANVWLKLEATRGALRLGITHFQFSSFDHYADTRSFTAKLGGVTTRTMVLMHRPIAKA